MLENIGIIGLKYKGDILNLMTQKLDENEAIEKEQLDSEFKKGGINGNLNILFEAILKNKDNAELLKILRNQISDINEYIDSQRIINEYNFYSEQEKLKIYYKIKELYSEHYTHGKKYSINATETLKKIENLQENKGKQAQIQKLEMKVNDELSKLMNESLLSSDIKKLLFILDTENLKREFEKKLNDEMTNFYRAVKENKETIENTVKENKETLNELVQSKVEAQMTTSKIFATKYGSRALICIVILFALSIIIGVIT